ncbi:MAG: ABC transporter ATP-binding protein [Candidatus Geothermarchaeales archaeon]
MRQSEKYKIIEMRGVDKYYELGDYITKAIDSVDLDVYHGDLISIMGPSGSGKSTLLNLIGCLIKPTRGKILIRGVNTMDLDDEQLSKLRGETIGFIFQGYNLIPTLTALENVLTPVLFSKGKTTHEDEEKAKELLKRVGLEERMSHFSRTLSYGEQQRVAIARSLMNDPELILADEPTGTLDTYNAMQVMGILKGLNEEGATIILVTHDPKVGEFGKTKYNLRDGKLFPAE